MFASSTYTRTSSRAPEPTTQICTCILPTPHTQHAQDRGLPARESPRSCTPRRRTPQHHTRTTRKNELSLDAKDRALRASAARAAGAAKEVGRLQLQLEQLKEQVLDSQDTVKERDMLREKVEVVNR